MCMCNIFTPVCHSFCSRGGLPQCMLGYHTPPGPDTPPDQTPPGSRPPRIRHLPLGADPPQDQTPPPPGFRLQHTANERPVRILLECILVLL